MPRNQGLTAGCGAVEVTKIHGESRGKRRVSSERGSASASHCVGDHHGEAEPERVAERVQLVDVRNADAAEVLRHLRLRDAGCLADSALREARVNPGCIEDLGDRRRERRPAPLV